MFDTAASNPPTETLCSVVNSNDEDFTEAISKQTGGYDTDSGFS